MKRYGLLMLLIVFCVAGCVIQPTNQQEINWINQISFQGFSPWGDMAVTIEGENLSTGAWDVVGSTVTASTPSIVDYGGCDLYYWSTRVVLDDPLDYFQLGIVGHFRAKHGDYPLYTFEDDGLSCMGEKVGTENKNCYEAAEECASPESPVLTLYHFPYPHEG